MNNVILCGRLVKDVELRFAVGSGIAIATVTLAVDKQLSKEKRQEFEQAGKPTADFPRLTIMGKRAETFANYLHKGNKVLVRGSIQTGSYEKQDGTKVYTTDVFVSDFEFVESKNQNNNNQNQNDSGFQQIEDDDDIPF